MKLKQDGKNILDRLFEAVTEDGLILRGDRVLVAFSGGADSVALLLMLEKLSQRLGIELFAAHLNHGIRGSEADRDQRFCTLLCEEKGIPIETALVNVPEEAKRNGEGLEECARRLRYDFLNRCAEKHGCSKIATAHHADDNVETVLLHLIRGSGAAGLVGISAKRDNIIRPLLRFRKKELVSYLSEQGQSFVTDSTNSDTKMTRNKIRHQLLDTVYEINPRADAAFSNMSKLLEADNEYLCSLAREIREGARLVELKELPVPVLSRYLQLRYAGYVEKRAEKKSAEPETSKEDRPAQLSYVHLDAVTEFIKNGTGSADFSLPGRITAHVSSLGVAFSETDKGGCEEYELPIVMGENDFSQYGYKILITNDKNVADGWQNVYKPSIRMTVSSDKIFNGENISLFVRNRKSGDGYVFGGHTRNVRRRLIDLKIPAYLRSFIPCVTDKEGIIWVPNLRCADRVKPTGNEAVHYIVYAPCNG